MGQLKVTNTSGNKKKELKKKIRMLSTLQDLEEPGALRVASADACDRLVLLTSGPDNASFTMLRNTLLSLERIGLGNNTLILADSASTCRGIARCWWSSRLLRRRPSDSVSLRLFWDWRFRFYHVKKKLMADLVHLGCRVLQCDTDTFWNDDPFPILEAMNSSVVVQQDTPLANAGVMFARPGSAAALSLLRDIAWRVQLFQNHPEVVERLVPFARPPYYANSDDQTILNDVIQSAVLGSKTFLGATARYEADNRHGLQRGIKWPETLEFGRLRQRWSDVFKRRVDRHVMHQGHKWGYGQYAIDPYDSVAVAPRGLFADARHPSGVVVHVAAYRGFAEKQKFLRNNNMWLTH